MRDITYVRYSTERFSAHPEDPHNLRPQSALCDSLVGPRAGYRSGRHRPDPDAAHVFQPRGQDVWDAPRARNGACPKGTFDWQPREFAFITDPYARWFTFTLQLRWTTGTVWYDDVELVDLGAVVNVETY